MRDLYLFTRDNCHLCEEMLRELEPLLIASKSECHLIKVTGDPELEQLYGARVPVLVGDGKELCEFKLDSESVKNYLELDN